MTVDVLDTPEAGGMIVRGGIVRVVGFAAGIIVSLLGVVLLTRHLGVARYGRYQTVISLTTVVSSVTDLGMATLGVREYAQRQGADRDRLMRVLLGLRLSLTVVGIAVAALIAIAGNYGWQMVLGVLLAGGGVFVIVLQTTLSIPLNVELRLGTLTAFDFVRQGLTTALMAALVIAGAGLLPFLAIAIPINALLLVWTATLVRGRVPLRPTFSRTEWAALVRPAIAFSLATAVGTLYLFAAQIITSLVTNAHQTGLFSASFRVFITAATVPGVLVTGAFPLLSRAARDDHTRLAGALQSLFAGTLVLGGAVALTCVLGAKPIIDAVGGHAYSGAVPVLRVQGATLLVSFVLATLGFTLLALHEHRAMIIVNIVAFLTTAATVITLGSLDGARGAAFGTLIGESVVAVGYAISLARMDRAFRPSGMQMARVGAAVGAGLAVGLLVGLPPIAATVLALVAYGIVALAVGAVPPDLTVLVRGLVRRRSA